MNRNRNPGIAKASLKSQTNQGTSLCTSATINQKGSSKRSVWHKRQSWGLGVSRPPRFWHGESWGRRGVGGRGCRGRVVKHYYTLSCTGSIFDGGDFSRKIE